MIDHTVLAKPCRRPGCNESVLTWFHPDYCSVTCLQNADEPVAGPMVAATEPDLRNALAPDDTKAYVVDSGATFQRRAGQWVTLDEPDPEPEPAGTVTAPIAGLYEIRFSTEERDGHNQHQWTTAPAVAPVTIPVAEAARQLGYEPEQLGLTEPKRRRRFLGMIPWGRR